MARIFLRASISVFLGLTGMYSQVVLSEQGLTAFNESQPPPGCLSKNAAVELATEYAEAQYCTELVENEDRRLCDEAKVRATKTWFNSNLSTWVATLWEGYCAPAAQCWRGVFIDCAGRIKEFEDGEE